MACGIKRNVDAATNKDVRFGGLEFGRQQDLKEHDVWCEFPCTRADDHPKIGKHWYEDGKGLRVEFEVPEDVIWMA